MQLSKEQLDYLVKVSEVPVFRLFSKETKDVLNSLEKRMKCLYEVSNDINQAISYIYVKYSVYDPLPAGISTKALSDEDIQYISETCTMFSKEEVDYISEKFDIIKFDIIPKRIKKLLNKMEGRISSIQNDLDDIEYVIEEINENNGILDGIDYKRFM